MASTKLDTCIVQRSIIDNTKTWEMQIDTEAAKWYLFSIEMCMRMCKPYLFVNITVANTNNLPQKLFTIILFSQHCEDTFSPDCPVLSPFRDFPTCPWPRSPRPSVPAPLMPQYQSTDHTFFLNFHKYFHSHSYAQNRFT